VFGLRFSESDTAVVKYVTPGQIIVEDMGEIVMVPREDIYPANAAPYVVVHIDHAYNKSKPEGLDEQSKMRIMGDILQFAENTKSVMVIERSQVLGFSVPEMEKLEEKQNLFSSETQLE
jgi:hypothetical protein